MLGLGAIVTLVALGAMTSQQTYSQTVLDKDDFYLVENDQSPIFGNGAIATDIIKCNGGDMMLQASYAITKRFDIDPTPDVHVIKELSKVAPNGVAREYEMQVVNNGPTFVNLRLTALCLDMQ